MIAIVDYGMGNLASVRKAFRAVGQDAALVADPAALEVATAIVLPGVGHFGHCARAFHRAGFGPALRDARRRGVPILGICVGMQLFFEGSEEAEDEPGLAFLPGTLRRMRGPVRVPQIGWNEVRLVRPHGWLGNSGDRVWCYFVHSYAADAGGEGVVGVVDHGGDRAAIVAAEGIVGFQFHPEKSGAAGLRLIGAWAASVARGAAAAGAAG